MMIIVLMHYNIPFDRGRGYFFEGAYIFVDFFFILQGYYLIDTVLNKNIDCEEVDISIYYLKKQLKKYVPIVFVFSSILMENEVFMIILKGGLFQQIVKVGREFLVQISFLGQIFPLNCLGNAGHLWFLSASLLSGIIVVEFVIKKSFKCKEKTRMFILEIIISVLCYNYILNFRGHMDLWHTLVFEGSVQGGIVRSLAGIVLGVALRGISEYINKLELKNDRMTMLRCFLGMGG